jgi:HAE1 family hydrophobic/amphiphilic exporter-1
MSITRFAVDNPIVVAILTSVVAIVGIFAAFNLGIVFLPDITSPTVTVNVTYPGASPAEMEQLIVKPIEDRIVGIPNKDTMQSTIQEGQALIEVRFLLGTNIDASLTDVQHRVDSARQYLPPDLDPPVVAKHDTGAAPIVTEAISSQTLLPQALSDIVTVDVDGALRSVAGVQAVTYTGAQAPQFHVFPDPQRLAAVGATLPDVLTLLGNDNVAFPGGRVSGPTSETLLGVHADVRHASDLGDLPVQAGTGGPVVRIRDVAVTEDAHAEARIITRVDGLPCITADVSRGTGADEVRTTALVRAAFADLAVRYPQLRFREIANSADLTAATVAGVGQSLLEGIVLTACVLMLALHAWRAALVVMIAIPTSLLATLGAMYALGFTLDLSSTMGLSLAIGILVDDSIVVLENIHHHFAGGSDRRTAAIEGRTEIGRAAIAITLVDVVVFLPIGFATGVVGSVLREFGLVVGFATITSLLVSFTLTPLLAARWSLREGNDALQRRLQSVSLRLAFVARWYLDRVLPWALAHPIVVVGSCIALLLASAALVPLGLIGGEVVPAAENGTIVVALSLPAGTAIGVTEATTGRLAAAIRSAVLVASIVTTVGSKPDSPSSTDAGNVATLTVQLAPNRWSSVDAAVNAIRRLSPVVQAAELVVSADQGAATSSDPIAYAVTGVRDQDVQLAADRIAGELRNIAGTVNVTSTTGLQAAQVVVRIDPARCSMLNVSPSAAALTARIATGGIVATRVRTPAALVDVLLQGGPDLRSSIDNLARVPVRSNRGAFVPLSDVATFEAGSAQTKIDRLDRQRIASISASLLPGITVGSVLGKLDARIAQPSFLPPETHVVTFGGSKLFKDTAAAFVPVLALSVIGMYLLMVILFGSLTTPLIVMCTLPVSLVGALSALALAHQSLNVFSVISIVMLFGLAAKNGILLVDFANRALKDGMSTVEAINDAARRRFQPIVMTTSAMILGSLPLALGFAEGGAFRQSMGVVLIGGLVSSLVLTLILIPVVYGAVVRQNAPYGYPRDWTKNKRGPPSGVLNATAA